MSSNSPLPFGTAEVDVRNDVDHFAHDEDEQEYKFCHPCHGSGLVWVHDQETDCLDCLGEGEVPI